jgi:hypothetical protein
MLGFRLNIWDFLTFAVIIALVGAFSRGGRVHPRFARADCHRSQAPRQGESKWNLL